MAEMYGPHDVAARDCCRTAGWAFARLFGVNPVIDATYKTNFGALRYLAARGGAQACHDTLATAAGLVPCHAASGVIGSVLSEKSPFGWVLAINITGSDWATMGPKGLCIIPSANARSWGVPWG